MAFHHRDGKWQGPWLTAEYTGDHSSFWPGVKAGEIMVALGVAAIDTEVLDTIVRGNDIAERGESLAGKWLNEQFFHRATLPHRRSRDTPPSGMMLRRTWLTGPSAPMPSLKLWMASIDSFCSPIRLGQNMLWVMID